MKSVTQGYNKFCGPAVLSVMTGKSTDECASILGAIQNRIDVDAVTVDDMLKACKKLRFKTELVPTTKNASMFYTLSFLSQSKQSIGLYMLFVRKHVVAIEITDTGKIFICDNHTKEPIDAAVSARLGQICLGCYKVTPKPEPILVSCELDIIPYASNRIYIRRISTYEDSDDNLIQQLGMIQVSHKSELKQIGERLIQLSTEVSE